MKMNKINILIIAAAAASLCFSCVRPDSSGLNDGNKRYFDSWMQINHPDAVKEGAGVYIIDETAGSGKSLGDAADNPYVYISYTTKDLEGTITASSDAAVAKQLGSYDRTMYYGPVVRLRSVTAFSAGQEMVLSPMRVGGTRTAAIPGWLESVDRYKTEQEYLDNVSGTDCIYTVTLHDVISDIAKWQIDSISRYMARNFQSPQDSLIYGLYYIQTVPPTDTASFDSDAKVYVNYTGSLLNGQVFDTSDKNTAKDAGLYSASKDYEPLEVTFKSDYTEISDLVKGFAYCVSKMRKGEKGTCIFYSGLGYEATASNDGRIPAYSPLRFDIEMLGTSK